MRLINWITVAVLISFAQPAGAQVTWHGPRQTPAELADVLRGCECPLTNAARRLDWPEGPTVVTVGSTPGDLGWLTFPTHYHIGNTFYTTRWGRPLTIRNFPDPHLRTGHGAFPGQFSSPVLTLGVSGSSTHRRR